MSRCEALIPAIRLAKERLRNLLFSLELNAEKIIFDNDLKPIQAYNLAKITGLETIDQFQLILEIFVKYASTMEA